MAPPPVPFISIVTASAMRPPLINALDIGVGGGQDVSPGALHSSGGGGFQR